jgi:hypothetical protein
MSNVTNERSVVRSALHILQEIPIIKGFMESKDEEIDFENFIIDLESFSTPC